MKAEYKKMMTTLIKDVVINLLITIAIATLVVFMLGQCFNVQIQISGTSLVIALIGATLAFAGNSFVSDALGRYDAHTLPQYIWGNRMQSIGFALTIAALLIK